MAPAMAIILRLLTTAGQRRTFRNRSFSRRAPLGGANARRPALRSITGQFTPTREAINLSTKLQYGAAAIEPPFTPAPAPQPAIRGQWKQTQYVKSDVESMQWQHLAGTRLALAQLRLYAGGRISGRMGNVRRKKSAAGSCPPTEQKTAARLAEAHDREEGLTTQGRHDRKPVES